MRRRDYLAISVGSLTIAPGCTQLRRVTNNPKAVGSREIVLDPEAMQGTDFDITSYSGELIYKIVWRLGSGSVSLTLLNEAGDEMTRSIIYVSEENPESSGSFKIENNRLEMVAIADENEMGLTADVSFEII